MVSLTNLTLGKKITLLTALGLLVGFGVFSTLGIRAVKQATETMLQDRLTTASVVAEYIDEALGRALAELKSTTSMVEVGAAEEEIRPRMAALEDAYSRLSIYIDSIYLLNREGQVVWTQAEGSGMVGSYFSESSGVGQSIMADNTSVTGLLSSPLNDIPVVLLYSPVGQSRTGNEGTLVVAIDLAKSSIGGFIQPLRLGMTGYVEIVDQNGIVVSRTEPGPELAPFEKSDHSGRFAALINAGRPTQGVCHTCHEPDQTVQRKDVLAFVPLTEADWGVVIRQSEEEALVSINELRRSLFIFGGVLATIALLFVIITTRNIGSRIRTLTNASQKMAEGDLNSPVGSMGKDEVGILARTIDDMRVKLKVSYDELEQRSRELASLLSVSEILTSTLELYPLLNAVVAKAVEIISGADAGVLLLQNDKQDSMVIQSAVGVDKELLPYIIPIQNEELIPGQSDGPANKDNRDAIHEAVNTFLSCEAIRSVVRSTISGEVFHRGRHIGSLVMMSFHNELAFSDSDYRLLQAIADDIAIVFERAKLVQEAEAARALQEADRLRSEFISSVSHELRTPLTLIKGYSTSLLRQDMSWDEVSRQEFLGIIDEKTDELRDLIDKILQSAKLEAGAFKLEKEPVLLSKLAQKIAEEMATRVRNHRISLQFAPFFPVIDADVRCMEQILRNLVENAVKYSPEGSEVVITGEFRDGEVIVGVSDKGQGIATDLQAKVFERFYRVDSLLTRRTGGSGLGLSIVKGHVEAHGGKIWINSVVGKGSSFYFSLPWDHDESDN